jgi:hypothetical protein
MTDKYNDALGEQLKENIFDQLASEAKNLSPAAKATLFADVAGIFDPTPACDTVGGVLSLFQGDLLGAGLSVVSYIPYIGDAAGKTGKIAKNAPRTAKAIEHFLQAGDNLAKATRDVLKSSGLSLEQVAKARKKALESVQEAMLKAKKKIPDCKDCDDLIDPITGKNRRIHMPRNGKNGAWRGGDQPLDGHGIFEFSKPKKLPDGRTVKQIEFKNGAPDFDQYILGKKHELWEVTGNAKKDGAQLEKLMRQSDPDWMPPNSKEYVLNHFEDGSVGYVPRVIHDANKRGVAHTGGNSMINNKLF